MSEVVTASGAESDESATRTADSNAAGANRTTGASTTGASTADASTTGATDAAQAVGPEALALSPAQTEALLRDLLDARVLSCVNLESVYEVARSLALSLEDTARVSPERAVALADALLAPGLRRLPTIIQCYVRVERAMRAQAAMDAEPSR